MNATAPAADQVALVTGASGFVGRYLTTALADAGVRVVGTSTSGRWPADAVPAVRRTPLVAMTLGEADGVRAAIAQVRPTVVFHLAAQANVPRSFEEPEATWRINCGGTVQVLDAMTESAPQARLVFVSTGAVYGQPLPDELPLAEEQPLRPPHPYAMSKAAAETVVRSYGCRRGLDVVVCRPFNHVGPCQTEDYAIASFARQIAGRSLTGDDSPVKVGQIDNLRDFSDVRDVVAAYIALWRQGRSGTVYNIGSGRAVSLRDCLEELATLAHWPLRIEQDADRMRGGDPTSVVADVGRLLAHTDWRPSHDLRTTLRDTLAHWLCRLRKAA